MSPFTIRTGWLSQQPLRTCQLCRCEPFSLSKTNDRSQGRGGSNWLNFLELSALFNEKPRAGGDSGAGQPRIIDLGTASARGSVSICLSNAGTAINKYVEATARYCRRSDF